MIKVVFIPEYLSKVLKDVGLPIELMLNKEKVNNLEISLNNYEENKSSDFNLSLERLKKTIGIHDFNTMININKFFSDSLYNGLEYTHFLGYGYFIGGDYNDVSNTVHNLWLTNKNVTFNDTYNLFLKNDDIVIIEIKEGFSNFITLTGDVKYKKLLLSEIISLFAKDKVIDSFLSQVYLQLCLTSKY